MTRADAADAEWDEAAEAIGAADIGDQLGGRPCRVQGAEYVPYPRCSTTMRRALDRASGPGGAW